MASALAYAKFLEYIFFCLNMNTSHRESIVNCATIAQILLLSKTTYIYKDFFLTKEKTRQYFPKTIKLFTWDEQVGWYVAEFSGVKGLRNYVSGAKTFESEYEKLTWGQKKICYYAIVQPFDKGAVNLCDKLDLNKDASNIICQLADIMRKEIALARSDMVSGIRGLGYGETMDEYNNLAHRVEECLKSKQSS
jgi:hypothetical protein